MPRPILPLMAAATVSAIVSSSPSEAAPVQKPVSPLSLQSGVAQLKLNALPSGRFAVQVLSTRAKKTVSFQQSNPLAISMVDSQDAEKWLKDGYQSVVRQGENLVCTGRLQTPNGTQFRIIDTYRALRSLKAFTLTRKVTISTPNTADKAFNSRFSLSPQTATTMRDNDFFAPGVWYKQNTQVPQNALASQLDDRYYYIREDRLPLPLVMMRDRRNVATLTLAHFDTNATTIAGEEGQSRIIDSRLQYASMGIQNTDRPEPAFLFPGTEGERTYTGGGSPQNNRWTYRSHPVQVGVPHSYRLLIQVGTTPDFPAAVRGSWRSVYDLTPPPVIKADMAKVYKASMDLLVAYCHPYDGIPSVPFSATVPEGKVIDTSSQMGFVGQALPAAAYLLRYGFETKNSTAITHADQIVDFWATNSMTPSGVPKTWYDIHSGGKFTWRNYNTYLRVASDGANGMLTAWNINRKHGNNKPEWLAFCKKYGDWLVRTQSKDGSWARSHDFDGNPVQTATDTTDQAIPFLANLYLATGDTRYRKAALLAGEFCWKSVHLAYSYAGGTPDNPNVTDKEAGMMALAAFLALYDISADRRWLAAASQAAWFSETWVYCWNLPIPKDDLKVAYPKNRTTYGVSLIATGHSGADNYMADAPFYFYRLYLLTGETHFQKSAQMLLHNTKQMMDWDNTLGYTYPGLFTEVLSLASHRGHGLHHWLPWLTVTILNPMIHLQDTFGSMDIEQIDKLPLAERKKREANHRQSHGFPPLRPQ